MRVKSFVFNSYAQTSRYAICIAIIYCSFLTATFLSWQDEFPAGTVEYEFYIGDEDLDDSPLRYLEIVGFHQSKVSGGIKCFLSRWTAVNNIPFPKNISVKINPQKTFSSHRPKIFGNASILYGIFRI